MSEHEIEQIKEQLHQFKVEHRDLDEVIDRLQEDPTMDQLQISRLKKRKLYLKDNIARLESKLIPDLKA
ncbi:MAG: YdcH family protein [Gammaproteobacteria bacterium]|nr:YdcH family protein [Gammaproteobacteria bacterium]